MLGHVGGCVMCIYTTISCMAHELKKQGGGWEKGRERRTGEREGWREELREEENLILGKTEG